MLFGFERESNTIVAGPTSSGKSTLLHSIIEGGIFTYGKPKHVYVLAPTETRKFWDENKPRRFPTTIHSGIQELENFLARSDQVPENSIVIFDDFMSALDLPHVRKQLESWFYVTTHHRNLWTFFVIHDLFNKHMLTIRRNTQNFILFNILQSDYRSGQEFAYRLMGHGAGSAFVALWDVIVKHQEFGWVRFDQKIHREALLKTVITTKGITPSEGLIVGRSKDYRGTIFIDAMSNPSIADDDVYAIPDRLITRRDRLRGTHALARQTAPAHHEEVAVANDGG